MDEATRNRLAFSVGELKLCCRMVNKLLLSGNNEVKWEGN